MKRFETLQRMLVVVVVGIACQVGLAADHTKDSIQEVTANLNSGKAVLVDVRERAEWDEGHLKQAKLIPLSQLRQRDGKVTLPKDKIVYGHCASGFRVLAAAEILKKNGYDFRPLKQGYDLLLDAGFSASDANPK